MPAENSNLPLTQQEIDDYLARVQVVGRAIQVTLGEPQDFSPTNLEVFQDSQLGISDELVLKLGIKPRELANAVVAQIEETGFV